MEMLQDLRQRHDRSMENATAHLNNIQALTLTIRQQLGNLEKKMNQTQRD